MSFKLSFAVSFSVLFITIQYAVFRKSFRTFYVSICYVYLVYILCVYYTYIYILPPHVVMQCQHI